MRENIGLFKAKDIKTREWVYGYLNGFCYIESERYIKTGYNEQHEIDPETICEYTGLLDRHGNKIWENDILWADGSYDLTVSWDGEKAMFYAEFVGTKSGHEDDDNDDYTEACDFINYEVIGNKFDNPENDFIDKLIERFERLTQYTSDGVAESYIGEADNINIYEGGMEGKYISGRQITKLAEYEDIGLTPQGIIELRDDATELFNKNKDQRIAELENEVERMGGLCDKLNSDCQEKNKDNTNYAQELSQTTRELKYLMDENAELKAKLENAIVPKFNFGDTIFAVVTYIDDPKDKTVIESGIVQKIECDKNQIKYWCDNGRIYWEDECEKLFATEQEAQQKLKELEETK